MPIIYLSPSTQEGNIYYGGDRSEEYYMNLVADAMEPYLIASGIRFVRNTPEMTAASSIIASNKGHYDLHLALHSNATGASGVSSAKRGSEVYYYPSSKKGQRAAEIIANNLKMIYPLPEKVITVPTTTLGEIKKTRAPAVLIEYAYHDNMEDAEWIKSNIEKIAANTVLSLCDYFDIPFAFPTQIRKGRVSTERGGRLNIRRRPQLTAEIIGKIPNNAQMEIFSSVGDWYVVSYMNTVGYVYSKYVKLV